MSPIYGEFLQTNIIDYNRRQKRRNETHEGTEKKIEAQSKKRDIKIQNRGPRWHSG